MKERVPKNNFIRSFKKDNICKTPSFKTKIYKRKKKRKKLNISGNRKIS